MLGGETDADIQLVLQYTAFLLLIVATISGGCLGVAGGVR